MKDNSKVILLKKEKNLFTLTLVLLILATLLGLSNYIADNPYVLTIMFILTITGFIISVITLKLRFNNFN